MIKKTPERFINDKIQGLWQMVGNTAMIAVWYRYKNNAEQRILVKVEHSNLTGSIKDRMALYILQKAYGQGKIKPGYTIVEATSGNTGISFAAIGKALGHKVKIFMPDWMSRERIEMIRSYGAEIRLVSKEEGGFKGSIQMAEMLQHDERVFLPRQFANQYNVEAHKETTGREIGHQLLLMNTKPNAFIAGVGTGGTVMGVGKFLSALYPEIQIHPLEPAESPTLTTGHKVGNHRIQGISDEFIPPIVDLKSLNKVVQVNDGDAILMAQRLGKELGLAVGISSGANFLGAVKIQQELGLKSVVVTVFPDRNGKYLSTDLFKAEPVRDGYITPQVKLLNYQVLNKV
ncbi:PLP-dependent cysteine synthase family protein [Mucilaginibacter pocheonensis]|uniref:Cysteine synthase A n=1 Tax=Mucilaginibacter pocheonensis TaxID=398050 RepID=A0ABU1T7I7_9SPHI|nr:PLP-dependent cysteine synthase family protein [Mucilaginibacter pocheonensis]MDR6941367.1 cysteine synthase A [Mucilaginibacter pocheonensis]